MNKSSELDGIDAYINIYVPDGHLEKGGVKEIWKHTGLPYPTDLGLVDIKSKEELENLKYKTGNLPGIKIGKIRPQDIPNELLSTKGIGISGHDLFREKLKIGLDRYHNDGYETELMNKSLLFMLDLECRPSYLVMAFPESYNIKNYDDLSKFVLSDTLAFLMNDGLNGLLEFAFTGSGIPVTKKKTFASEYVFCVENSVGPYIKYPLIKETYGKTETFVLLGITHGMVEIVETGKHIFNIHKKYNFKMKCIKPWLLMSTPEVVVHQDIYNKYKEFIDDLVKRLDDGKRKLKREKCELFEDKLKQLETELFF